MADDIEATVILTDEEVEAYREWAKAPPGKARVEAGNQLLSLLLDQLGDYFDRVVEDEDEPEEDDRTCPLCIGTGIPQSGPPDVGFCSACKGTGVRKAERDPDDYDPPDDFDDYEGS